MDPGVAELWFFERVFVARDLPSGYVNSLLLKMAIYNGNSHLMVDLSIAMLVYQRVSVKMPENLMILMGKNMEQT